jgi:hypothetical protein
MVNVETTPNRETIEETGEVCVEFKRTNGIYFRQAVGSVTLPEGDEVDVGVSVADHSLMMVLPRREGDPPSGEFLGMVIVPMDKLVIALLEKLGYGPEESST